MKQSLALVAIVVRDYDEAIDFYTRVLGFTLVEDTFLPDENKRWVVVAPPGATESRLLLARASNDEQRAHIGNQTGGRVFLFLHTDDFQRDYDRYRAAGVEFVRPPTEQPYGTVAVFKDLYGNLWDLVEPKNDAITRYIGPRRPITSETSAKITNTISRILAIQAASPAMPPKPNTPATIATIRKIRAQRSMSRLHGRKRSTAKR